MLDFLFDAIGTWEGFNRLLQLVLSIVVIPIGAVWLLIVLIRKLRRPQK